MGRQLTGEVIGTDNKGRTLLRADGLDTSVVPTTEKFRPQGIGSTTRDNHKKAPKTKRTRVVLVLGYSYELGPFAKEWAEAT